MAPIVDDGGFGPVANSDTPGGCSTTLLVIGPDRAGITRALRRVCTRVFNVVTDGRELTDEELEEAYLEDLWNINYAGEPEQLVRGVGIAVDFKGEDLTPEMGATYRAITREELEREGVTDARLAVPSTLDHDTAEEGMFASAGARSIALTGAKSLERLLRVLFAHLPDEAMMIAGTPYGAPAVLEFLARHDRREESPLAFLSEGTGTRLDPETVRGFWEAAAVPHDRPFELVERPLWFVEADRVIAYAPFSKGAVRVRADADPALLRALESDAGAARKPPYREWFVEHDLDARVAKAKPALQPEEGDWWDAAWRVWEPVPDPPAEPPPPFDPIETAARIRKSVQRLTSGGDRFWHWQRAPYGAAVGADEASAVLGASYADWQQLTVKDFALAVARHPAGRLTPEQASKYVWYGHVPSAARLAALVAIAGPQAAVERVLSLGTETYYRAEPVLGLRAAVLPHLDREERDELAERVRARCRDMPWSEGIVAPHVAHLIAGQLGLHDVCAETLATNPDVLESYERHLVVHGLGSRDEVVEAHRRMPQRFAESWHVSAWLAVTGRDGIEEAFEGVKPQYAFGLSRLAPLLRIRDPAQEPHMRELLGTPLETHARKWLKANT